MWIFNNKLPRVLQTPLTKLRPVDGYILFFHSKIRGKVHTEQQRYGEIVFHFGLFFKELFYSAENHYVSHLNIS